MGFVWFEFVLLCVEVSGFWCVFVLLIVVYVEGFVWIGCVDEVCIWFDVMFVCCCVYGEYLFVFELLCVRGVVMFE